MRELQAQVRQLQANSQADGDEQFRTSGDHRELCSTIAGSHSDERGVGIAAASVAAIDSAAALFLSSAITEIFAADALRFGLQEASPQIVD